MFALFIFISSLFASSDLMSICSSELERSFSQLQEKEVYWIGLGVTDLETVTLRAQNGASSGHYVSKNRYADIDLRIGNASLDNTHPLRDAGWFHEDTHFFTELPIENNPIAIQTALWKKFDEAYKSGSRRLIKIKSNDVVKVEMEDQSADFSMMPASKYVTVIEPFALDEERWMSFIKKHSSQTLNHPDILESQVTLFAENKITHILNTEGTRIIDQRLHYRISVYMSTIADDGMQIETYNYKDLAQLPPPEELDLSSMMEESIKKLLALKEAPVVDPYVGPAILKGRAAAVFFHEIFGHRAEGHRQKDESEGKTLTDKIGKTIFPEFISIYDDPTLQDWNGTDLNGYYLYDDEGVKSERVDLVENGVLQQFLLSRSPIENFPKSNGHGRRQIEHAPVARQGNLIVQSSLNMSYDALREELIKQIKTQEKEFGLIFDDISGGFTFTGRTTPNSYNVRPVTVWKVYADGRPDELVRGVDMIGTPLLTFSRIIGSSNTSSVFNGSCGAESGWVPVSAVAPDLLISEVEVQRKEKGSDRPPILQSPSVEH